MGWVGRPCAGWKENGSANAFSASLPKPNSHALFSRLLLDFRNFRPRPGPLARRILFHSATLLGTALYLLAMSAAGYYLRFFGGSWGAVMQLTFLFGAVALLVGMAAAAFFADAMMNSEPYFWTVT